MSSSQTVTLSPSRSSRRLLRAAALTVAAALFPVNLAHGQTEPAVEPAAPAAEAPPATTPAAEETPSTQPATRAAAANGQAGGGIVKQNGGLLLNFRDASIDVVLDELSAAAGFIVVKEVKPEGRVTLTSRQPVSADDAVSLLNTVLHTAGYGAIQQGRILKVVPRDVAKRLSIPVRSGNDPTKIEPTDELITQVIPLRHADAQQLRQDLQPVINPQADFTSNASSNALVITDTAANVRRIVQIVAALDTSLADAVDVKVFQLKFANAANAAKLINDVFGDLEISGQEQNPQDPRAAWRRFQQQQQQRQQQQQQGGGARNSKLNAAADERTNSVVVTGPTDMLAVVADVLKELDENPAADETVFVYRLRNAQAINLEGVINTLFGNTTGGSARNSQQQQQTSLQQQRQSRGNTNRSSRSSGSAVGGGGRTMGGNGNQQTNRFAQAMQQTFGGGGGGFGRVSPAAMQTAADLEGQVTIIADPDTNSLLVRSSPVNHERVREVLAELDRPVAQVLIKVLIAEVTHNDDLDYGAEFSVLNLRAGPNSPRAATDFNIPTGEATGTGLVVQIIEQDFTATIRALETEGKLDVLSRPYILASDNQLASITVGQEVPFITNSRITDDGGIINTTQYGDVGILLDVVPHINPDGLVILDVAPEISTLTGQSVQINEQVSQPIIAKRSAESRVGVRNGQTIVIGGLMEDRKTETINKVPLLGDIPIIGELFKRTRTNKSKTELLIFLTPHVASDPDRLQGMSDEEVDGTKIVPNAVTPGTFQEHYDGLQRGRTADDLPPTEPVPPASDPVRLRPRSQVPQPEPEQDEQQEQDERREQQE